MSGFFPALGDAVARFRWLVVAFWIVFVGVCSVGARRVDNELVSGNINVRGSESERGNEVLDVEFDRRPTRAAIAVFTSSKLVTADQEYRDSVSRALDEIKAVEGVDRILSYLNGADRFVSPDKHTTYAVINLAGTEEEAKKLVPQVREALDRAPSELDASYLTGYPASSYDLAEGSHQDLKKVELYTVMLTVPVLLFVFGTIVAAGLPVILAAAAVVAAEAGIFLVAQRMETSIFAKQTASMIGLGLGIDFSLLMVSRYREELARGITPHLATVRTVATAGKSIVFSGLTVMLGLSVMLLYDLTLIRSIALGMLLVAGLAVLGAVTLLPAILCLFGRRVNALSVIPGRKVQLQQASRPGRWHTWSLTVMRYPWLFLLLSVGFLVGLAIPFKQFNSIGTGGAHGVGPDAESRQGFEVLNESFPVGEIAPISVVIRTNRPGGAFEPSIQDGIWNLTKALETDSRVARVDSLANLDPSWTLEQFKAVTPDRLAADPRQRAFASQYVNLDRTRDTLLVSVVPKYEDSNDNTTELLRDLRGTFVPTIRELRGTDDLVTGSGALTLDFRDNLYGQFPSRVGLVLAITYVVLLLFFHSLLLPLKAILMNLLSIVASYGVMVMVFQWGILDKPLNFEHIGHLTMFSPPILFSVLFGLSTDYEVFLLSRVKELYRKSRNNEQSVAEGLERTAGIITAAGLIMVVVFGSFALGNVLVVKELGVGQAVAVLLDATIVRIVLVPASMRLMGNLNWWMPRWLNWIPEISEGAEPEEQARPGYPAGLVSCPSCGARLPVRARFCGNCGRLLQPPGAAATGRPVVTPRPASRPVQIAAGAGETLVTRGFAVERGAGVAPQANLGGQMPASGSGLRRVPIMLRVGNVELRAWLSLRDCHVEKDPSTPDVPVVNIEGVDVRPLPGQDPPEIQVRNARIRL